MTWYSTHIIINIPKYANKLINMHNYHVQVWLWYISGHFMIFYKLESFNLF